MLTYTLSVNLSSTSFSEMEIVNELLLIITSPFLLQSKNVGGPPLVSPTRVKVRGSARNEEEERDTWLVVITPYSTECVPCGYNNASIASYTVITSSAIDSNSHIDATHITGKDVTVLTGPESIIERSVLQL